MLVESFSKYFKLAISKNDEIITQKPTATPELPLFERIQLLESQLKSSNLSLKIEPPAAPPQTTPSSSYASMPAAFRALIPPTHNQLSALIRTYQDIIEGRTTIGKLRDSFKTIVWNLMGYGEAGLGVEEDVERDDDAQGRRKEQRSEVRGETRRETRKQKRG